MANSDTLLVRVSCNMEEMLESLKKAENSLESFRKTAEDVSSYVHSWGTRMQTIGLAFQGMEKTFSWIKKGIAQFSELGASLEQISRQTGVASSRLSALKYAAEQSGSSLETAADAMKTFQEQLGAAQLGDAGAIGKLSAVGIDSSIFQGLDGMEAFQALADHISSIPDKAEQARTAIELFGEAGYQLLPLFQQGSKGIQEFCEKAEELGYVMGDEDAAHAQKMTQEINNLKSSISSLTREGMAAVARPLIEMSEYFRSCAETITVFVKNNQWLVQSLLTLGKGLLIFKVATMASSVALAAFHTVVKFGYTQLQLYRVQCSLAKMQLASMPADCQKASIAMMGLTGRVSILGQSLKALFLSNPIGWIALATGAVIGLGNAFLGARAELQDFQDEKEKAAEKAAQETDALSAKLDRLKELSTVEERTRSEQKEMESLLRQLAAAGLDVNKIYDEQTGKLSTLAQGYEELKKSAKWNEADALEAANAEIMRNMRINGENMGAKGNERSFMFWGESAKKKIQALEDMAKKGDELAARFRDNLKKIEELRTAATQEDDEDKRILEERKRKEQLIQESQKTNVTVDQAILQASFADDQSKELYENEKKFAELRRNTETSIDALDAQRDANGQLSEELQKKYEAYQEFYAKLGEMEYDAMIQIREKYAAKEQEAFRKELEAAEKEAQKKAEEARKVKEENTKRLLELQNQLADAALSASQKELRAIRAVNAELEERLRKENDLTEAQRKAAEEALRKNQGRETALTDEKLDPAQALFLDQMDQLQANLASDREEYFKALEAAGHDETDPNVQKAKTRLENSQNAIQELNLTGAQNRLEKVQTAFNSKKDELANAVNTEDRLRLSDELEGLRTELEESRNSVFQMQNDAAQKKIQAAGANQQQKENREQLTISSNGTFSAYGLDAAVGADIPKQSLDQLKKICQAVLGIYDFKTVEGFV